jgi:hypothetical protein
LREKDEELEQEKSWWNKWNNDKRKNISNIEANPIDLPRFVWERLYDNDEHEWDSEFKIKIKKAPCDHAHLGNMFTLNYSDEEKGKKMIKAIIEWYKTK